VPVALLAIDSLCPDECSQVSFAGGEQPLGFDAHIVEICFTPVSWLEDVALHIFELKRLNMGTINTQMK
jgi:hypothetical protein